MYLYLQCHRCIAYTDATFGEKEAILRLKRLPKWCLNQYKSLTAFLTKFQILEEFYNNSEAICFDRQQKGFIQNSSEIPHGKKSVPVRIPVGKVDHILYIKVSLFHYEPHYDREKQYMMSDCHCNHACLDLMCSPEPFFHLFQGGCRDIHIECSKQFKLNLYF